MPSTATTQPGQTPEQPGHPLYALTTYELAAYRRDLEGAITSLGTQDPIPPAQADLQARLIAVLGEQDDRARLTAHA
jgi:hypothetical protein